MMIAQQDVDLKAGPLPSLPWEEEPSPGASLDRAPGAATASQPPQRSRGAEAFGGVGYDAFMGPPGFPNPWLWPTDAAAAGAGLLAPPQAAGQHPLDFPMKIALVYGSRASAVNAAEAEAAEGEEEDFGVCRWHKSAETVGIISSDGHVFTKTAGPRRSRLSDRGARVELASICMVFDASLRCGGVHRYCYRIMEGELGAADGAGFVFDSKVRRNNIQRMRSVFLNQRGRICLRNNQQVTKLQAQLPPLTVGVCLTLVVDLDSLMARFNVTNSEGALSGSADVSLDGLFDLGLGSGQLRSGFFCAVVTGSIAISIN